MKLESFPAEFKQTGLSQRDRTLLLVAVSFLCLILVLLATYMLLSGPKGIAVSEPVLATGEPAQSMLPSTEPILIEDEDFIWRMYPRATYRIEARVTSRKMYWDWQAKFAPWDLALGWGELSNPDVDEWLDWKQSGRAVYTSWVGRSPFPDNYIREHSANVHIIPATDNLELALKSVSTNDLVLLEGLLVDVEGGTAGKTQIVPTSLSRTDEGCEILYVERLVVAGMEYR